VTRPFCYTLLLMSPRLSGFSFFIYPTSWKAYQLFSTLVLEGITPEEAFRFFEDPRNLLTITPPWLDFRMLDPDRSETAEGTEFDYTIRWLGLRFPWKSRIINYHPPAEFTDIQIKGPYASWEHCHLFKSVDCGTLMTDQVDYILPRLAFPLHRILIRKQLEQIFRYRALRIEDWVQGTLTYRSP